MGWLKKIWDLLWSPLSWIVGLWGLLVKLVGYLLSSLSSSAFEWMSSQVESFDAPALEGITNFLVYHLAFDELATVCITILSVRIATRVAHAALTPVQVMLDLL